MENFVKVVRVGKLEGDDVFCTVCFKDGELSIAGVIGPKADGDSRGGAGQINMTFKEYDYRGYCSVEDVAPAPAWTPELVRKFFDVWGRWHLNKMKAGSPAQEAYLRANPINNFSDYYGEACKALAAVGLNPDPAMAVAGKSNGYKYGSAWLREEVPQDVLEFLRGLPDTDVAMPKCWRRGE